MTPHFNQFYPDRPVDASHPDVLLDFNRCILCELCIRASAEVDGKNVFALSGRGITKHLIVNAESGKLADTDFALTDKAAQVCPVGVILRKTRRLRRAHRPAPLRRRADSRRTSPSSNRRLDRKESRLMNAPQTRKLKVATTSLAGCFGCHMSFLDIDERMLTLLELVEFDRSPITDIKHCGPCDIGIIEGGVCNAENVHVLREFRANCKILIALGACASMAACRRSATTSTCATSSKRYTRPNTGLASGTQVPNDPELPLPLNQVHPIHEVVKIDYFLPGCPPSGDAIWKFLTDLIAGRTPHLGHGLIHYD